MSLLSSVIKGVQPKPRRTVLYGTHGIGKSTWAAQWPSPIFLPTEDGSSDLEVPKLPLITEAFSVYTAAMELSAENAEHGFRTVVLDSADWLEKLIWKDIIREAAKATVTNIDDIGYGKGHTETAERFRKILSGFNGCRDRGLHVVIIAHCEIKRFESPEGDSYDRYMPKLHRQSASLLQEWADEVLFATYKTFVRQQDEGFGRKRSIGIGGDDRVLKTCERPGYLAKNRLRLPEELPLNFADYAKYLPTRGNILGDVINGSSKV